MPIVAVTDMMMKRTVHHFRRPRGEHGLLLMHFLEFFHHEIELRWGAVFKGVIDFPKVFLSIEIPAVGPTHQDDRCKNDDPQDNPSHRFHLGFGVNNTRGPTVSTRANGLDGVALSGDLIDSASVRNLSTAVSAPSPEPRATPPIGFAGIGFTASRKENSTSLTTA
jgi:hypothetical protein